MTPYHWAIEELALAPERSISLGNCSPSTVYRWARRINEILEFGKYDWRVRPCVKERSLYVVSAA